MNKFEDKKVEHVTVKEDQTEIKNNKTGEIFDIKTIGHDENQKPTKIIGKKDRWITPTKLVKDGKLITNDPNEVYWECYNPNNYTIVFENCHPHTPAAFPKLIHVEPKTFKVIPNRYYRAHIGILGGSPGEKITFVMNFGNEIGKGNKGDTGKN